MPLPKPKTGEAQSDFIGRCMGDRNAIAEFPAEKNRLGYCHSSWDQRTRLKKALGELGTVIRFIKRVLDKYDRITMKLADVMITTWNQDSKDAIADLIRTIKRTGPYKGIPIKKKEIDQAIGKLSSYLGQDIVGELNTPAFQVIEDIYINEIKTIAGTSATFNLADEAAMAWTQKNTMYWIGKHYDDHLSETVNSLAEKVLSEGMDRQTAAGFFEKSLGALFNRSSFYWDLLSNHIVTRSREFGRVGAYEKADIDYIKIKAVIDHRTSRICRMMHNKIIEVKKLVQTRDKIINAKDPEAVKEIAPWTSDKDVDEKYQGAKTKDLPAHLSLPPFHGRCRTRTVRSRKSDWDKQNKAEDKVAESKRADGASQDPKKVRDKISKKTKALKKKTDKLDARLRELQKANEPLNDQMYKKVNALLDDDKVSRDDFVAVSLRKPEALKKYGLGDLWKKIDKNMTEMDKISDQLHALTSPLRQEVRDLIYFNPDGIKNFAKKYLIEVNGENVGRDLWPLIKADFERGMLELSKFIDPDILKDHYPGKTYLLSDGGGRGFFRLADQRFRQAYSVNVRVAYGSENLIANLIHEFGHWIESTTPGTKRKVRKFLDDRTRDEKAVWLGDKYKKSEITKKDKFISSYMGKIYSHGSTEILSMGLEMFYSDPMKLATEDPEMFDFIYNLVRGRI